MNLFLHLKDFTPTLLCKKVLFCTCSQKKNYRRSNNNLLRTTTQIPWLKKYTWIFTRSFNPLPKKSADKFKCIFWRFFSLFFNMSCYVASVSMLTFIPLIIIKSCGSFLTDWFKITRQLKFQSWNIYYQVNLRLFSHVIWVLEWNLLSNSFYHHS